MSAAAPLRPARAAASMVAAMALVGVIDNTVVLIADVMSVWQFFVLRSLLAVPMIWAIAKLMRRPLAPVRWDAVALRSMLVALAMVLYFGALGFMPIAEALAGLFTAPIFVLLISVLVQGKHIGPWRVFAVGLGFAGVLLVLQPGGEGFHPLMALPLLGGLLYASGSVITRTLCGGEETLTLLIAMFLAQLICGLAGLWVTGSGSDFITRPWVWDVSPVLHLIIAQAVFSLVGVGMIIWAYQHGDASHVAVYEYSVFIFGPLFAYVYYGQLLNLWAMLGIAAIVVAGSVIALRSVP